MFNFLQKCSLAFSYSTRNKAEIAENSASHGTLNAFKFAAYIPIVGPITQVALCVIAFKSKVPKVSIAAFITRALLSPIAPLTLPALDFAGTIVYAITKNKHPQKL